MPSSRICEHFSLNCRLYTPPVIAMYGFFLAFVLFSIPNQGLSQQNANKISYSSDIRPILAKKCFACHGPDEHDRGADLRLDRFEDATDSAIVPAEPEESDLFDRITTDDPEMLMPPPSSGKEPLTTKEIDTLRQWIKEGAVYESHWSFRPVTNPPVPKIPEERKPIFGETTFLKGNSIDHFILKKAERSSLRLNPIADKYTLARRLALDLTGMPPTESQLISFLRDDSREAYTRYVDQLLASPRFGEHWATMWLDLARYADTDGYADDYPRTIWPYRDWVIRAFNNDMPFDQFTIQQLAGDLLPNPTLDQKIATGFHRNTMTNSEGGTIDEEFRIAAVKDRVDTTMQVWNGFTAGCAKCHSHKYDPMTQQEYYQLFAIFNQTADTDKGGNPPFISAGTPVTNNKLSIILKQFSSDAKKMAQEKKRLKLVRTPVMSQLPATKQRETFLLVKGNWSSHGQKVTARLPTGIGPKDLPIQKEPNRLDLAKWLLHPNHPLTSRVQVNRVWAKLFGKGLVRTEEDFGTTGSLPSHPMLLDYLAHRYSTDYEWSLKELLKEIVCSATYRQSSKVTKHDLKLDPVNKFLCRFPKFRLSSEQLRDQALQASGLLNEQMFGPGVVPRLPVAQIGSAFSGRSLTESKGTDIYRRAVYTYVRRSGPYPATLTFDGGERQTCLCRRIQTNTPLQALTTLNDDVFFEAAQGLARTLLVPKPDELNRHPAIVLLKKDSALTLDETGKRILLAYFKTVGRFPNKNEIKEVKKLLKLLLREFSDDSRDAKKIATIPIGPLPEGVTTQQAAAWTVICNVLLNLDETLTR